jgi:asparagine synthase (glutamine-hydrolysing)
MAFLAGVLSLDGAPRAAIAAILRAHATRHGAEQVHETPELTLFASRRGFAAVYAEDAVRAAATVIGRIDEPVATSDANAVLDAYTRRGRRFAEELIGDFSAAVWDAGERVLILARDAFGAQPLFWLRRDGCIAWSSHLPALLDVHGGAPSLDLDYLAAMVSLSPAGEHSPVAEIRSVPAACAVIVSRGRTEVVRHWQLDLRARSEVTSDADAEERFRHLFAGAVRACVRDDAPATVLLSGGLDSSSIVCVADTLALRHPVQTLSYVFEQSRSSDEREYIEAVEAQRGVRGTHIGEREQGFLEAEEVDYPYGVPSPNVIAAKRCAAVAAVMRRTGSRILLTGLGGDHLLYSDTELITSIADALHARRPRAAARLIRQWAPAARRSYLQLLWSSGIAPLLGRAGRERVPAPWWSPAFARVIRRWQRGEMPRDRRALPSRRLDALQLQSCIEGCAQLWLYQQGDIEVRHPFLHRPFVEFCFALPFEQKLRDGVTRSIHRRALAAVLPPSILHRTTKSGPDEALLRAAQRNRARVAALFGSDAAVVRHGLAARAPLDRTVQRLGHGFDVGTAALMPLISLELWLRWLEHRPRLTETRITTHQEENRYAERS